MGKSLPDPANPPLARPRFSLGRIARGGAVACLWLWTSTGALSAAGTAHASPVVSYQDALERFNHGDYERALDLLRQLPTSRNAHVQADRLNLQGAIYLREHRNDEARTTFTEAARLDPGLLAAHFNAVEVSFREKRYTESHRQFTELLTQMGKGGHTTERRFIEYKLMLGDLLDGKERPALDFIAEHRTDEQPPLAWFYLNAALERQHGHDARADAWLQQVGAHYTPMAEQVFAESFAEIGWAPRVGVGAERLAAREERPHALATVVKAAEPVNALPAPAGRPTRQTAVKDPVAQLAVVSLFPDNRPTPAANVPVRENTHADDPHPAFHFDGRAKSKGPEIEEMPPSEVGLVTSVNESIDPAQGTSAAAQVFAKPTSGHRAHASPSPSASPDDGQSASSSPLPSPDASVAPASKADATPSGTPSPAFVQKYESATVQFLQKDYVGATKLLDEADAIQGGQLQSVTLRNQIFKQYYEGAYSAYQHADFPGALTQLDGADATHSNSQNQSDAYNLRGLILSKQRNYEAAESMFHKAVQTDPGLWAAKFNYAEVPFNYRNFTVARARFEELFSQTDPVKQPVEAELTQFKVFLTLLLEGKEDAARTFMQHFNFSGATPARYFCQAALNFYSGDVDKAQGWIDSARKEYPPRKSSSFLEAFYRVGWLTDPNAPETAARPATAAAIPSPTPAPSAVAMSTPSPTPAPAVALSTPKPSASVAAASATPTAGPAVALTTPPVVPAFRALVTPPVVSPSPTVTLVAKVSPSVAPSASPAPTLLAKASATPSSTPVLLAKASATPTVPPSPSPIASATAAPTALVKAMPTASASPLVAASPSSALVKVTPTASPIATPAIVKASAIPSPTASATAIVVASPKPTASLPAVAASTPSPVPSASAAASESPEATPENGEQASEQNTGGNGDVLRVVVVGLVGLYFLYVIGRIGLAATGRKSKRGPTADASTSLRQVKEADEVEVKR